MACKKCTATTAVGITLCERCEGTTRYALTNIAAYYADLDRVPTGSEFRRRSSSTPDPTGIEAAHISRDPVTEADRDVTDSLTRWADRLRVSRPSVGTPPTGVLQLAPWLAEQLPVIVTLDWSGDLLVDLLVSERLLKRVAQRARTGNYLGVCGNTVRAEVIHDGRSCACSCHLGPEYVCDVPGDGGCGAEYVVLEPEVCDRPLYAGREDQWVTCRCGATWDTRARRQEIVRAIEDELAPVAVIARLAVTITGEASVGRIENRLKVWAHRRKIQAVTTQVIDGRKRQVYRVGDVLDLLADTPTKTENERPA